jgi:hypothetical protein
LTAAASHDRATPKDEHHGNADIPRLAAVSWVWSSTVCKPGALDGRVFSGAVGDGRLKAGPRCFLDVFCNKVLV